MAALILANLVWMDVLQIRNALWSTVASGICICLD